MSDRIPSAAIAPVVIVALVWVAYCVFDIVTSDQVRSLPKWVWALICVLSVPVGGILYFAFGRDR